MKKSIAVLLTIGMLFTMAGCGGTDAGKKQESQQTENSQQDSGIEDSQAQDSQTDDKNTNQGTAEGSMGEILAADFLSRAEADGTISAQDLADAILTNSIIEFMGTTTPVEPGFLTGFDNDISGFETGVMFAPMIGSIPFVGYVFTVPEGADVEAFITTLKENSNPRWNICTEADETRTEAVGNTVFFLMCPTNMEE